MVISLSILRLKVRHKAPKGKPFLKSKTAVELLQLNLKVLNFEIELVFFKYKTAVELLQTNSRFKMFRSSFFFI
jgi:hypothetical protein